MKRTLTTRNSLEKFNRYALNRDELKALKGGIWVWVDGKWIWVEKEDK
jgi:hypothetical protein